MMRKLFAVLLSLILVLSAGSAVFGAQAAEEAIAVGTEAEFLAMDPAKDYYLSADITLYSTYDKDFKGTLDGKNHTVTVSCPMFAQFDGAVKNLTVNGSIVSDDGLAVAAFAVRTVVGMYAENVTTNVNITLNGDKIGMYAAGILASDYIDPTANDKYYHNGQVAATDVAASVFMNCRNTGNITVNAKLPTEPDDDVTASSMAPRAGGIAAYVETAYFFDCENTGDVSVPLDVLLLGEDGKYVDTNITSSIAGGIVAKAAYTAGANSVSFYGCKNSGDITAYSATGGIAGYVGVKSNTVHHIFYGCVNSGIITGASRVGGMVGYAYGTLNNDNEIADIQFCLNTGDILHGNPAGNAFGSPFVAYTNSIGTRILSCLNTGKVLELGNGYLVGYKTFVGVSSCNAINCPNIGGNFVYNPDNNLTMFSYSEGTAENRHDLTEAASMGMVNVLTTLEKVASGEVAYQMNKFSEERNFGLLEGSVGWACGYVSGNFLAQGVYEYQYMWRQKLGTDPVPTVDKIPGTFIDRENDTYKNADTVEVITTAVPETTEAPETTKKALTTKKPDTTKAPVVTDAPASTTEAPKTEEKKGCGSVVSLGTAFLVTVLGTALLRKKKA